MPSCQRRSSNNVVMQFSALFLAAKRSSTLQRPIGGRYAARAWLLRRRADRSGPPACRDAFESPQAERASDPADVRILLVQAQASGPPERCPDALQWT